MENEMGPSTFSSRFYRRIRRRRRREEEERRHQFLNHFMMRQNEMTILMSLLLSMYTDKSEVPRSVWSLPKSMHWWTHVVLATWDDKLWLENFRMRKATFQYLLNELRPHLQKQNTRMRKAISPDHRLAITLWKLATNIEYRTLAGLFGVGRSTVCVIFLETIHTIVRQLKGRHIAIPTGQRLQECIQRFEGKGFPQAAGAIDGSHIPIRAPRNHHSDYYNRKSFYSIILQAVVDSFGLFIDINCGWPGSVHDARVFSNSSIFRKLQNKTLFPVPPKVINNVPVPVMLLGDPAYPLMPNLMKAYSDTGRLSPQQNRFNYKLSTCRITVEHSFGRLKGRWRILSKKIDHELENVAKITVACCILHNVVEAHGNPFHDEWYFHDNVHTPRVTNQAPRADNHGTASAVRSALTQYLSAQ